MDEICDDYENVDQVILPSVARDCAKLGFVVERSHILNALGELIESGLANAYLLSGRKPEELRGVPPLDGGLLMTKVTRAHKRSRPRSATLTPSPTSFPYSPLAAFR